MLEMKNAILFGDLCEREPNIHFSPNNKNNKKRKSRIKFQRCR